MGLLNIFKKNTDPYFIKNTDTVFSRVIVRDLINFFQETLRHYQIEQDETRSFLGNRYGNEIKSLTDFLELQEYLEYLSSRRDKICELSITQDNKLTRNEEISWRALMKCDEFAEIVTHELLQQTIIKNNAMLENNSHIISKSYKQMHIMHDAWKHLNNYKKEFPDNFSISYVLFQIS